MQVPVPPSVPYPLWLHPASSTDGQLLSSDCPPAADRSTWILLCCRSGRLPLQRADQDLALTAGECRIIAHPDASLGLAQEDQVTWQTLAFAFVGWDELMRDLQQRQQALTLPSDGWAMRQLTLLLEDHQWQMQCAAAIRLVAGVIANLVEHNLVREERAAPSALVRTIREQLDAAVESELSLGDIARALNISPPHMSKQFKQHMGIGPRQYLQERRMRRACELLRDINLSVKDIAGRLGYNNQAAFAAAFHAAIGFSPTDFRNSRSVPLWGARP